MVWGLTNNSLAILDIGEDSSKSFLHYINTPMQYTAMLHGCKNDRF